MTNQKFSLICTLGLCLLAAPAVSTAQDDRGDRGRRMERGDNRDRSAQMADWLNRMDRDDSGYLEPQEIQGRARDWVRDLGFDLSRSIAVSELMNKIAEDRAVKEKEEAQRVKDENRKVPGFRAEFDLAPVAGFKLAEDDPLNYSGNLADRYGKEIADSVAQLINERDRDRDGSISFDEARGVNWGSPDPRASDLNRDGQLTAIELAERLKNRSEQSGDERRRGRRQDEDDNRRGQRLTRENPRGNNAQPATSAPNAITTRTNRAPAQSLDAKVAAYAADLLGKYDKNNDGHLDSEERKEINTPIKDYDEDGLITRQEIEQFIGGVRAPTSRTTPTANRTTSGTGDSVSVIRSNQGWEMVQPGNAELEPPEDTYRRRGASATFLRYDTNKDGQIQMAEYSTSWDDDKLAEFRGRDQNGDGIITIDEWGLNVSERTGRDSESTSRRRRDD